MRPLEALEGELVGEADWWGKLTPLNFNFFYKKKGKKLEESFYLGVISLGRVVASYSVRVIHHIGSAVREVLRYTQIDILLLYFKNKSPCDTSI